MKAVNTADLPENVVPTVKGIGNKITLVPHSWNMITEKIMKGDIVMKRFEGFMHGINLGGWLSQCAKYSEEHYSEFISENDIKTISEWGLDHVRLPVDHNVIEDDCGLPSENGYKHIDDGIMWCKKYGLNVILDLHNTEGFSFNNSHEENVMFDSPELQERFISLWINMASRFGKHSNVAFELLNEVAQIDSGKWNALSAKTISSIRPFAPDTKIIIGGTQWNSVHTLAHIDIPRDKNIVFNFHFYEPFIFTHQLAPWQPPISAISAHYPDTIENYRKISEEIHCFGSGLHNDVKMGTEFMDMLIWEAVNAAEKAGVPLYCGEYGVIDRADINDTAIWFEDIHSVFEKYGIGRAAWTYKSIDFGLIGDHYTPCFDRIINTL